MKNRILILDDEIAICSSLTFALEDKYDVKSTTDPKKCLMLLIHESYDIVLLDLRIGTVNGIDILKEIKNIDPSIQVIIMTAYGSIVSSVDAIKKGAFTYLTKPLDLDSLENTIDQALDHKRLSEPVHYQTHCEQKYFFHGMIGKSNAMKKIFGYIDKLKDVDTSVIITGESGTGKELVSRAIHYAGKRKNRAFVEVNCAAIPDGLLEEELFGHKKGTFTGAINDKIGKFEYANNGTIFLDEIGDMSYSLQAKLLRVLQQKEYTPLGSNIPIKLNIRVLAATNRDLKKMVEEGHFRSDLYYRLSVIEIALPPLREKIQDLPLLFSYFIDLYNKEMNKQIIGFSKEAEQLMLNYQYPGNVRELSNIIECAVLLAKDKIIEIDTLPVEVKNNKNSTTDELDLGSAKRIGAMNLLGMPLQEAEKHLISAALELNKGHKKATAIMLGISERGLRNKIIEYGLRN